MSLIQKKYKRLLSELRYVNSELEYVEDVLKEAHVEFEKFYQQYCKDYNIPLDELNKNNADKLKKIFPKKKTTEEQGLVVHKDPQPSKEKTDKTLQKMYRKAAIMTHPDKFSENDAQAADASEKFKKLTSAFNEKKWVDFLDICEKLDILPSTYKKVIEIMKKEIEKTKLKTNQLKKSYSWMLFECEGDVTCKMKVIKNFLLQIFGYEKRAIII